MVIAHYQEPAEELAGTLRAALEMDYPAARLVVSVLDDGFFTRRQTGPAGNRRQGPAAEWSPTPGGLEVTSDPLEGTACRSLGPFGPCRRPDC